MEQVVTGAANQADHPADTKAKAGQDPHKYSTESRTGEQRQGLASGHIAVYCSEGTHHPSLKIRNEQQDLVTVHVRNPDPKRKEGETPGFVFAIEDGIGGHEGGLAAVQEAKGHFENAFKGLDEEGFNREKLEACLRAAPAEINTTLRRLEHYEAGVCYLAGCYDSRKLILGHQGDVEGIVIGKNGEIRQRTFADTVKGGVERSGTKTPEYTEKMRTAMATRPQSYLRGGEGDEKLEPTFYPEWAIENGDIFIAATDGL